MDRKDPRPEGRQKPRTTERFCKKVPKTEGRHKQASTGPQGKTDPSTEGCHQPRSTATYCTAKSKRDMGTWKTKNGVTRVVRASSHSILFFFSNNVPSFLSFFLFFFVGCINSPFPFSRLLTSSSYFRQHTFINSHLKKFGLVPKSYKETHERGGKKCYLCRIRKLYLCGSPAIEGK